MMEGNLVNNFNIEMNRYVVSCLGILTDKKDVFPNFLLSTISSPRIKYIYRYGFRILFFPRETTKTAFTSHINVRQRNKRHTKNVRHVHQKKTRLLLFSMNVLIL